MIKLKKTAYCFILRILSVNSKNVMKLVKIVASITVAISLLQCVSRFRSFRERVSLDTFFPVGPEEVFSNNSSDSTFIQTMWHYTCVKYHIGIILRLERPATLNSQLHLFEQSFVKKDHYLLRLETKFCERKVIHSTDHNHQDLTLERKSFVHHSVYRTYVWLHVC